MTFEEAVVHMMRKYWKDKTGGFESSESFKSAKYTKKYFDKMKEELTGDTGKEKTSKKKKAVPHGDY